MFQNKTLISNTTKNLPVLIKDAPDIVFAGYPANPKAGYRISGRIPYLARQPYFWGISNKFFKIALTIIHFFKL
jgi:hypothetical protein